MKKTIFGARRALALLTAALLLTGLLAGCGEKESAHVPDNLGLITGKGGTSQSGAASSSGGTAQSSGTAAAEDTGTGSDSPAEPDEPAEPSPAQPDEPEPAEPAPVMRPLTEAELSSLEESLDFSENGFFVCSYDRPETIVWDEVFYNGAGVSIEPSEEMIEEYEHWNGEIYADLEVIRYEDVLDFVEAKTGTDYRAARQPLTWEYSYDYDVFMREHGDTNYQPIHFTSGETDGTLYRLFYVMDDWARYEWSCPYVMTAEIRDGAWRYISNLPSDSTPPVTLLTVEYFETESQLPAGITHRTEIEWLPSDENSGWCWALLTSQADGVQVSLDRDHWNGELESMYYYEFYSPDENLERFTLNRGETAAFRVNQPWYPVIRLSAICGSYYGEYWFGEDNWLHLWNDDGTPMDAWVTGHDYDGEGRGCNYGTEVQLANFLSSGTWLYYLNEADGAAAAVTFSDYRSMRVENDFEVYQIFLSYGQDDAAAGEAPNLLMMEKYSTLELVWETVPLDGVELGVYRIEATQLEGEQLLRFIQVSDGVGVLNYLFPDYNEDLREFVLHRYIGAPAQ